jgi:hypothetical protein
MKKIIEFFKNWFEKYGVLKTLSVFLILIICIIINQKFPHIEWIKHVLNISGIYLLINSLIFIIAGIVNFIGDIIKRK